METAVRRRPGLQRGRPLTLALAGLTTLVACSSNPAPAPLADAATSTATSTPSPSGPGSPSVAAPPTMPAAARGTSVKAAKAFVRYWVRSLDYAGAHGDTRLLADLSGSSCQSCSRLIREIDRINARGGYIHGAGWSVRQTAPVAGQPAGRPILQVQMFLAPQQIRRQQNSNVIHFAGGLQPMVFHLVHRHARWVVERIDQVQ